MFTGIVETVGEVRERREQGGDARLRVVAPDLGAPALRPGDSIAVGGVCLTAAEVEADGFVADVSGETLTTTALGDLGAGSRVNLERPVTPSTPLGGHMVTGHVDGVGELTGIAEEGRSWRITVRAPDTLARYIAPKGAICVDGVSLTVNEVDGARFGVNLIPHTLERTTLGGMRQGCRVNLEVDIIARYLERLLMGERAAEPGVDSEGGLTYERLAELGFAR